MKFPEIEHTLEYVNVEQNKHTKGGTNPMRKMCVRCTEKNHSKTSSYIVIFIAVYTHNFTRVRYKVKMICV